MTNPAQKAGKFFMRGFKKFTSSKLFKILFLLLVLFIGYKTIRPRLSQKEVAIQQPASVKPAKATTEVKKSFKFSASKIAGKGEEEVNFTITTAELKDEIKVKGVPRKANKGNLFLLLRLEIENESTNRLSLTPADLIRLVGENEKKFAPDFHNATIIIDPISVRKDLVSFIVSQEQRKFTLLVGELEKEKEKVEVNF